MPHRGRYTERPAPATDAARVGQDAIGSAPRHSSQASRAGCLLCDALRVLPPSSERHFSPTLWPSSYWIFCVWPFS